MIRPLYVWEHPLIVPLAREFHAATGVGAVFSEERLLSALQLNKSHVVGRFHEGRLIGILVGIVAPHFLTESVLAQELMWYVSPEFRGSAVSNLAMLDSFERWAKACGADSVAMVALEKGPPKLGQFYENRGFTRVESNYLKFF